LKQVKNINKVKAAPKVNDLVKIAILTEKARDVTSFPKKED
jgi:hypothetical protein